MKSKKTILFAIIFTLLSVLTMASGIIMVQSAQVSTVNLVHQATYTPPSTVSVTLLGNEGTFAGNKSSVTTTFKYGGLSQLEEPSRAGYGFNGWKDSNNNTVTNSTTFPFGESITLTAQWTANTYYVHFNGNGYTSGSMSNQTFTYGVYQNLTNNGFTKTGYKFLGWATSPSDSVAYNNQQSVRNLTDTNGATVQLYARWSEILTIPSQSGTLTYNGSAQTPSWSGYDSTKMNLSVDSQTNAGNDYTARFTLKNTTYTCWNDAVNPIEEKTVTWSIQKLAGTISYAVSNVNKSSSDAKFTNPLTITGDGEVSYSTNNASVAEVSSTGEVTLKGGEGVATITATTSTTSNTTYATATATYTVTVANVQVTDLSYFTVKNNQITGVARTLPSEVIIPDTITGIMNNAFEGDTTMTSITIPSSVVGIGYHAFYNSALTSITFEDTNNWWECLVTEESGGAGVSDISSTLAGMTASAKATAFVNDYWIEHNCSDSRLKTYTKSSARPTGLDDNGSAPAAGALLVCSGLTISSFKIFMGGTDFVISYGFTDIAAGAAKNKSSITSVVLPASMQGIGNEAFSGCTSLTSITIPASVEGIGYQAFNNTGLTSVTFEDPTNWWISPLDADPVSLASVNSTNNSATNATLLKTTYKNAYWTKYPMAPTRLNSSSTNDGTELYVPSIGYMGNDLIHPMSLMQEPEDANAYNVVGFDEPDAGGLCGTYLVTNIVVPFGLVSLDPASFTYTEDSTTWTGTANTTLKSIRLPRGLTSLSAHNFHGCTNLTSVILPSSLTTLGPGAFYDCTSLESVVMEGTTVPTMGYNNVFTNTNNCPIYVPMASWSAYRSATYWSTYSSRMVGYYRSGDWGWIGTMESKQIIAYFGIESSPTLPYGTTGIMNGAFAGNSAIQSITIPASVEGIGWKAFANCPNLTSVTFASTTNWYVTNSSVNQTINVSTPATNATNLKTTYASAYWTKTATAPTAYNTLTISNHAIPNKTTSTSIKTVSSAVIPYGVTSIGNDAFAGTNASRNTTLTSVRIPNSVTKLGRQIFSYCPSLTSLVVSGGGNASYRSEGNCIITGGYYGASIVAGCNSSVIPTDSSINSIDIYCFEGSGITSITIPSNIDYIGGSCFSYCSALQTVTVGDVLELGLSCFQNCSNLTSVYIESTEFIGESAFNYSTNLESLTINSESVVSIDEDTLVYGQNRVALPKLSIYVRSSLVNSYKSSYSWLASTFKAIP